MFRKSNKELQVDAFASVSTLLESSACKQYSDPVNWHNQFREQVVMRIDEDNVLFYPLQFWWNWIHKHNWYNKTFGVKTKCQSIYNALIKKLPYVIFYIQLFPILVMKIS